MSKRDYYEILGVSKNVGDKELKSAFRKAAMQCHPDRHPGDKEAEKKFKDLNEAYQVLSNPDKRAAYDRYGHQAFSGGGGDAGGFNFSASMSDIFEDLFGEMMGGGRGARRGGGRQERGNDLRFDLELSLEEAFHGKSAEIELPMSVKCETCGGSGAKSGTKPVDCRACHGSGRIRSTSGFFTVERPCGTCAGTGQIIENPCSSCRGSGKVNKEKQLSVEIPAGIDDNTRIRMTGEGEVGFRGGPAGDLHIFVSIRPHEFFQRDGANLLCRMPVPMAKAALGAEIEVPTIDGGKSKVKIPSGIQSGSRLRLRGLGMSILRRSDRGDMFLQVEVETPANLSARQKELLEEFDEISSDQNSPLHKGFFDRVKGFWDHFSGA